MDVDDGVVNRVPDAGTRGRAQHQVALVERWANLPRRHADTLVEHRDTGRAAQIEIGEADGTLGRLIGVAGVGDGANRGHCDRQECATDCGLHDRISRVDWVERGDTLFRPLRTQTGRSAYLFVYA